jgi:hypothetical protein
MIAPTATCGTSRISGGPGKAPIAAPTDETKRLLHITRWPHTAYPLNRHSRKAAFARFLRKATREDIDEIEDDEVGRRLLLDRLLDEPEHIGILDQRATFPRSSPQIRPSYL